MESVECALEALRDEAMAWAVVNGLMVGRDPVKGTFVHCPVSLLPSKTPKAAFDTAKELTQDFNTLYDRVSRDSEFLMETLARSSQADPWLARLLAILRTVREEGVAQPITLGLHRSDYMLHTLSSTSSSSSEEEEEDGEERKTPSVQERTEPKLAMKIVPLQVEFNTISTSHGCLSSKVTELHHHLLSRFPSLRSFFFSESESNMKVPSNPCGDNIALSLAEAVQLYQRRCLPSSSSSDASARLPSLAVLMVVQEGERNSVDQRLLEYALRDKHGVPLIRRTLAQIADEALVQPDTKQLIIGEHIIAVSYYRAGYTPNDFKSEKEWEAVLQMERSLSIKCPSVALHLAGTKKVQQMLAQPGVLERFVSDEVATRLRTSFAGLWGLEQDDEQTRAIIKQALATPEEFVLKPQREGGGNNLWGHDMVKVLKSATVEERAAYILMQRIRPPLHYNVMMRDGELTQGDCVTELGFYSAFLGDGKQEFINRYNGYNLRTKLKNATEGGVVAGFSTLGTPFLV